MSLLLENDHIYPFTRSGVKKYLERLAAKAGVPPPPLSPGEHPNSHRRCSAGCLIAILKKYTRHKAKKDNPRLPWRVDVRDVPGRPGRYVLVVMARTYDQSSDRHVVKWTITLDQLLTANSITPEQMHALRRAFQMNDQEHDGGFFAEIGPMISQAPL